MREPYTPTQHVAVMREKMRRRLQQAIARMEKRGDDKKGRNGTKEYRRAKKRLGDLEA